MGLDAYHEKLTGELSTGSRRIVDLACILAQDPSVLMLDEPSGGVAQKETEALGPLLLRVRERTGCSILVIEHDMPLLSSICDQLVALETGARHRPRHARRGAVAPGGHRVVPRHRRVGHQPLGCRLAATSRVRVVTRQFSARAAPSTSTAPPSWASSTPAPSRSPATAASTPAAQADARGATRATPGALIVDVGGQSANTKTPELAVDEEIGRLVPLIEAIRRALDDRLLSVDTYKPAVADACLAAGADVINDVSGLLDPELADVVARWDAGYVLMHTVGPPKSKVLDPTALRRRGRRASWPSSTTSSPCSTAAGVRREQVVLDPGLDFGKTPRQSLDLVARAGELHAATEQPLLFAVSRKDFIGAIAGASPLDRDPGTLATVGALAESAPD